jgi:hypothetical protein
MQQLFYKSEFTSDSNLLETKRDQTTFNLYQKGCGDPNCAGLCNTNFKNNDSAFSFKLLRLPRHKVEEFLQYHFDAYEGPKKAFLTNTQAILGARLNGKIHKNIEHAYQWTLDSFNQHQYQLANPEQEVTPRTALEWKNKTEQAELIHALYKSKRIRVDGRPAQKKEITSAFETMFNTDLSNLHDLYRNKINSYSAEDGEGIFTKELHSFIQTDIEGQKE